MTFADNFWLIFELNKVDQLQQILNQCCNEYNIRLSEKSKYYVINNDHLYDDLELKLDGIYIERVNRYKSLGFNMQNSADFSEHISNRLQSAQDIQT